MTRRRWGTFFAVLAAALLASGKAWAQPAPVGLTAAATGFSGQVALNWTAPADVNTINGYNIYMVLPGNAASTFPGGTPYASLVTSTSYTTALPSSDDGQSGAYWVTTVDTDGEGAPAGPVVATSYYVAPAASFTSGPQLAGYGNVSLALTATGGTDPNALSYISVSASSNGNTAWLATIAAPATAGTALLPFCGWVSLTAQAVDVSGVAGAPATATLSVLCGPDNVAVSPLATSPAAEVLSWNDSVPVSGAYVVVASTGPVTGSDPLVLPLTVTSATSFTYAFTTTTAAENLFYRVYAVDANGVTSAANAADLDKAYSLGVPQFQSFNEPYGVTFTASWGPFTPVGPLPAQSYSLYAATETAQPYSFVLLTTVAASAGSITLPVSTLDTAYFLSVSDGAVSSSLTPPASSVLDAPYLSTPTVQASAVNASEVELDWSPVAGASGYSVYRTNLTWTAQVLLGSVTGTSYMDSTSFLAGGLATSSDTLNYAIQAYSTLTPPASTVGSAFGGASISNPLAPSAPPALTATATGAHASVTLAWSAPAYSPTNGLSNYEIFYSSQSSNPQGPGIYIVSEPASQTSVTLSNLAVGDGNATWFWVAGSIGNGPGAYSASAEAIPYTAPTAPTLTAGVLSFGQGVTLTVTLPSNPDVPLGKIKLFETLNSVTSAVETLALSSTPLTAQYLTLPAGALPCGGVSLSAQTVDIAGNTGTPREVWVQGPCAPAALTSNAGALVLSWSAPTGGASRYAIFSATGPGWNGNPLPTTVTVSTTALEFTPPASPGLSQWYRVYAVDSAGVTSAASNEVGLLGPPSQLQASPSAGQVYLAWSPPPASADGATNSYVVYYSSAPGFVFGVSPGAQALSVAASSQALTVTGLVNFTSYAFAVASQGGGLSGTVSAPVTMTTGLLGPVVASVATSPPLAPTQVFQAEPLPPSGPGSTLLAQWTNSGYTTLPSTVYSLFEATDATATPQTYNSITLVAAVPGIGNFVSITAGAPGPAWYFINVSDSSGANAEGGVTTNARTLASAYFAPNLSATALTCLSATADGRVLLQWNPVAFADTYTVYRATQEITTVGSSGVTYSALSTSLTPATFTALGTVQGTTGSGQAGGPLTYTALAFIDTAPVENARNAYEVVPSMQLAGGSVMFGPASNAVTSTPRVLPGDPGLCQVPGLSATAGSVSYYVTATALADSTSTGQSRGVFLEWAPAGDGSNPISYYSVYRGFSPQSLSFVASTTWFSYAPTTRTVHGVSFTPAMPNYVDLTPPQPVGDLYYGVSATDVSGNVSPDIVTGTVGAALPWPAPFLVTDTLSNTYFSSSREVGLDWSPGALIAPSGAGSVTISAGTFPFAYWQVQRVAALGASPTVLVGSLPEAAAQGLTNLAATTFMDLSPVPGAGLYLIEAVDVQGNAGTPLGISVTVPTSLTNTVPHAASGLTASAVALSAGISPESILGETLDWLPNPASDAVTGYMVYRQDALGITSTAVPYPPFTDALGGNDTAGEGVTYTVVAWNSHGAALTSTALEVFLSPPAPAWVSFTADIPAGVSQTPAVGLAWNNILHPGGLTFGNGNYTGSYSVFRSDNLSTPLAGCTGITSATCADVSPLAAASYFVESVATNSGGGSVTSPASVSASLSLPASAPAAPSSLSAFSTSAGVSLVWTAALTSTASGSTGPYEYWVYRSSAALSSSPPYGAYLARVSGTAFVDTGTLSTADGLGGMQTQPYYAVAAAGPFQVGAALTVTAALDPPSGLSVWAGSVGVAPGNVSATVTLAWAPSLSGTLVTGYNIWRASEGANGPVGNTYLTTTASTTFTDVSLTSYGLTDTVLSYTVMAQGASTSACTAPVSVTAYDLPRAPVAVIGNGLPMGVDLSWRPAPASQGVTGYAVTWNVFEGGGGGVSQVAASPQSWSMYGLVPGQGLTLTVQALNSAGASPISLSAQVTLTASADGPAAIPAYFTAQSGLSATAGGLCGVFLSISAPAADTLVIYRSPGPGMALPASPLSWSPLRLTAAAGGAVSPYYLTTVPGSFTSLTDTSVTAFYRYSYAITAVNVDGVPGGESEALASSPTSVKAYSTWAAPGVSVTAGNARVDLTWAAPALSGQGSYPLSVYRLYRQQTAPLVTGTAVTLPDSGFPLTFSLTQTAYVDTQVTNGLAYAYDMTSVDSQGNESALPSFPTYAQYNGATAAYLVPEPPLPAPTNLSATVGGYPNLVTLRWVSTQSDTSAGASYNIYRRQEFSATTCTSTPAYGPPLPDGFHVGPPPFTSYGDVTVTVNTFVDGAPGEPDPPQNLVSECYAVTAVDGAGEGPKSQEICVTPYNPLSPSNTVWSAVIVDTTQVLLTWNDVPANGNAANGGYKTLGYSVQRSSNDGGAYTQIGFVTETAGATASTQQQYEDTNMANGEAVKGVSYYYQLYPVDVSGNVGTSYGIKTIDIPSGDNSLYVYRNSFDPMKGGFVPIQCGLQQSGTYWVKIFTLNGEYVNTIIPPTQEGGTSTNPYLSPQVDWNGTNAKGQVVASGVYLIHLQGPGFKADARVAVIK